MHLFGHAHEPHLTRFKASRDHGDVVLRWDVRNAPAFRWRVLRSESGFAETTDVLPGGDQTLVSESPDCGARDDQAGGEKSYYYTVFAQDAEGIWHRQVKIKVDRGDKLSWHRDSLEETARPTATSPTRPPLPQWSSAWRGRRPTCCSRLLTDLSSSKRPPDCTLPACDPS